MTWLPYLLAVLAVCYVTAAVLIWRERRHHRRLQDLKGDLFVLTPHERSSPNATSDDLN